MRLAQRILLSGLLIASCQTTKAENTYLPLVPILDDAVKVSVLSGQNSSYALIAESQTQAVLSFRSVGQ